MNEIVFPTGVNPTYRYVVGGDYVPKNTKLSVIGNLYMYATSSVIDVKIDTSNVTNMGSMFQNCSGLTTIPLFDTSNVTNMKYMFSGCSSLTTVPLFNTSKVTDMSYMFNGCSNLTTIPLFDTSNVTNMQYMFQSCSNLTTIPELDFSNATNINNMFQGTNLTELPNINCKKITSLSGFLYRKSISKVGVIDCDSLTNASWLNTSYVFTSLTDLGGFRNIGMQSSVSNTNANYFIYNCPNLTRQSLLNVFNLLYDRASAGYSVLTIKLHPNHYAKLTDDDIAIATNKGWTLA
jgi:surface protein